MKTKIHAAAGVIGFLCILAFVLMTAIAVVSGSPESIASAKGTIFKGMFLLISALLVAGGSGVSLLGQRQDMLALTKQRRGPIAFMTSLLILLPCTYFLSRWADVGAFGAWYYAVQTLELLGSGVVIAMIGLNIRDGLKLTGRIVAKATSQGAITPIIDQRDGGPLVAMAIPKLTGSSGEDLDTKPVTALCRCGASQNKPYCDGSHNKVGFDSSPSEDRTKDEVLIYEGTDITVHYNRLLCSHAGECGARQKAAFDSSRKPWIIPDNASFDDIKDVVKACPSGALRFSNPGENPQHIVSDDIGITVEENGPYRVAGIPLATPTRANGASSKKYVLCRCGASKNKPYCDGSHFDIGWKSAP